MKKFLLVILAIAMLVVVAFAGSNSNMTNVVSVNAAAPRAMVAVGPYTVVATNLLYTSITTTGTTGGSLQYFGLCDAATTGTAATGTPWKVTVTVASPLVSGLTTYEPLGFVALAPNGSGYGVAYGVTFTSGCYLDGGTYVNLNSVTGTVAVIGR